MMSSYLFCSPMHKEREVVFRQIGHRLLLSSNDSSTRVLPIQTLDDNLYAISFDKPLYVKADSLYKIIAFELGRIGITEFISELKECKSKDVYLSFMFNPSKDSITPCAGRDLPEGCYTIEITILKDQNRLWLVMFIFPIVLVPLFLFRHKFKDIDVKSSEELFSIGTYSFDPKKKVLFFENQNEVLTEKEAKLLTIFLNQKDEILNRDFLMNEIWAESGVLVVSKNLDVLVSKLRKKLIHDDKIKISNVHGVGYKLEIG